MSKTLIITGAILGSLLSASAWAFPASSLDSRATSDVILAADGCGPGYHRGPYGHCRPNVVIVEPRICGFGWHFSRFRGRCVPNY